jgi:hypothetical protein
MAKGGMRRIASIGAAVALATAGSVLAFGASAGAASVETSFEDDGKHQWTVPEGVCAVWVDALGASGGDAISPPDPIDEEPGSVAEGGEGGEAEGRLVVTPGETLYVYVGSEGEDAVDDDPGEGGFNGGGDGGAAGGPDIDGDVDHAGAGGGGASDVRQGGDGLEHRVIVAGGGGGAAANEAGDPSLGAGGEGGGEEGEDGLPGAAAPAPQPDQAGEGGNEDEGGDGGVSTPGLNGDDGEAGEGGDGGGAVQEEVDGGGGGGGGWFGGGGGAGAGDLIEDPIGYEDGAGGGGGSGYGPAGTEFHDGEHDGDGEVTISYDPVTDGCVAEAIVIEPKFTG